MGRRLTEDEQALRILAPTAREALAELRAMFRRLSREDRLRVPVRLDEVALTGGQSLVIRRGGTTAPVWWAERVDTYGRVKARYRLWPWPPGGDR
jgi:hypothetical protein